jgi:hypothetical protein
VRGAGRVEQAVVDLEPDRASPCSGISIEERNSRLIEAWP